MHDDGRVADPGPSNLLTVVGVAIIAYAASDMVHEVLGHGIPTLLSSDVRAVMLTTVALSTDGSSRAVVAGGTIANLIAALVAFLVFQRMNRFGATRSPGAFAAPRDRCCECRGVGVQRAQTKFGQIGMAVAL